LSEVLLEPMNTDRSPQFLYFDLGNVLLTFDVRIACRQVGELTGLTPERVDEIIFGSGLQERYERGEVSSRAFYEAFCADSGTRPDYDALHLASSAMFQVNVPVIPLVAHLQAARYRLGILSNTCESHWRYVAEGRYRFIRELFEVRVLSCDERCCKPATEIFRRAAHAAQVAADEIFFVDDRPENVQGAREAGLDAVLYEGPRQLADALRRRGLRFNY